MLRLGSNTLNLGNPVNSGHPLNRGLVSWWLPLPNNNGGSKLFDLCNRNHATLTNGPTWASGINGFRSVSYDGTNDYAEVVSPAGLPNIEDAKTIEIVTQYDGTTGRRIIFTLAKDNTSGASNSFNIEVGQNFGLARLAAVEWGGTVRCEAFLDSGNANISGDTYFHIVYTCSSGATSPRFWINGKEWTFGATTSSQTGTVGVSRIASFNSAFPDPYHNRPIQYVKVLKGTASDTYAANAYKEWKQGFPNLLNRYRSTPVINTAGGGTSSISGSCDLVFAAGASTLTGTGTLTGTTAAVFDDGTSTLTGSGALAGSSAVVFDDGASTLTAAGTLAGSVAVTFDDGASTLTGTGTLTGSADAVFDDGASTLTGTGALAGSADAVFGSSASLTDATGGSISGTCSLSFGEGASTLRGTGTLAGTVANVFGAGNSTLTGRGSLAGSTAGLFTLEGVLTDTGMTGTSALTFGAAAVLTGRGALAGSAALVFGEGSSTLTTPDQIANYCICLNAGFRTYSMPAIQRTYSMPAVIPGCDC